MIYPSPQSFKACAPLSERALHFVGDCVETAEKLQSQYPVPAGMLYNVNIVLKKNRETEYIDELSRLTDEKYNIKLSENEAIITAATRRGVFRAVHTLLKLNTNGELCTGEITDYPLFEKRGYIEGFYGTTWEPKKRRSVMQLMAKYGMNAFYYAPKDDIYHREKWREPYPKNELNELKNLFDFAVENEMDFCWCIGPGLTYCYTSEVDFEQLIKKIKSIYEIGVRRFGLLLDDIPAKFQYEQDAQAFDNIAAAHISLINRTYEVLKKLDCTIGLTVCPTEYFGNESGYYISKLGKNISSDINIFWTGQEICSRVLTCRESDDFFRATAHKPLFWDNYPVNDAEMFQEMHLAPLIGRDTQLYKHCNGLIANVMEYAECSKIPLMSIADYLWNPLSYCPESSHNNALHEILGEKAELFKYIDDHLCVSCLNRHGSALMSQTLEDVAFLKSTGQNQKAANMLSDYIEKMNACLKMLQDTTVPLFAELEKWVEKFAMCCSLLDAIYSCAVQPNEKNKAELADLLQKYNRDAVILTGFCLREAAEKALLLS